MLRATIVILLAAAAGFCAPPEAGGNTAGQKVAVTIDAGTTAAPISPYIYGQFIEHIGDLVNRSIWAEMIDDRKFYHPIVANPAEQKPVRARRSNRWLPISPEASVVMDREHPYAGDHAPLIKLEGADPRGIRQSGLALRKGKAYTGRIVLAGDPGAKVTITMSWGPGPGERRAIPIAGVRAAFASFPFKFVAGGDSGDGRIEISGTGRGTFHVGAVSLMPADNTKGFRPDIIALLKAQRSGMYRFPGGNFLSAHDWHDAIGDPDKRPSTWDPVWSALQPNDVGTDEFLTMCELLGVEAFISVNSGFGDAYSAAEQVEYVNGATATRMGRLRAANGHPAPYNVKWWGIGNEMYGDWQFGNMALKQYVIKHNMFAKAMRKVDPTIKLLATGATPDEMTIYGHSLRLTGKLIPDWGSEADWTGGLFTHCLDNVDIMSEHFYSYAGQRFDHSSGLRPGRFSRSAYMEKVDETLVEFARRPANRVRNKVEAYEEYARRIPGLKTKPVPMAIDEWAYARPSNLKSSLADAFVLQEMFRHSELIVMAGHTMATAAIEFNADAAALTATGLVFKLYRDHFGAVPVRVTGSSPVAAPLYPVGADQPKINAGSPTYPLDVSAAISSDGRSLTVAVINATEATQTLDLDFQRIKLGSKRRLWRMTGAAVSASSGLNRNEVQVIESTVPVANTLEIAPASISIYEFEKQ
ncbi:MAG: alpha-N-arabinofuranosidase [Bryobacterales bacterium]|nr:alpha-N-arabinofuranosidase [Bryobacterales bacterium]